jgi:hypothetical protein
MRSIHQDPALNVDFQSILKIQSFGFVEPILNWILTNRAMHG